MRRSKSVAILAEMGTGKTLISIGIAGYLYLQKEINKLEFRKWNNYAVPVRVNRKSFSEIMKCWREE